jgi:hypothetical protein
MYKKILRMICSVVGHKWYYKDYTGWMENNGEKYYFEASRNCLLYNENQYFTDEWKSNEKSKYDIEKDSQSSKFSNHH